MNTSSGPGEPAQNSEKAETIRYLYRFKFANSGEKDFEVVLDAKSLELVHAELDRKPEWTKLKFSQCENCPLGDEVEYCPVAVNLSRLVETFQDRDSFEATTVAVETPQRTYVKNTTLQKGLSSIIGIYMATSNCPVMDKLRPMTRFHLPFATSLETFYRTISMYVTAQLLRMRNGEKPDWELKDLLEIYKGVSHVNKGISRRLVDASAKDASQNAIIILHSFGDGMSYFIENGLDEIRSMFSAYTDSDSTQ